MFNEKTMISQGSSQKQQIKSNLASTTEYKKIRISKEKTKRPQTRNDVLFPGVYSRNYKPLTPQMLANDLGYELSGALNNPTITIQKTRKFITKKRQNIMKERESISKWLEKENPSTIELLLRLSESGSEYSKFYRMAAEELQSEIMPIRKQCLDDLEMSTKKRITEMEVEIQKVLSSKKLIHDEIKMLKNEIYKKRKILDVVNSDISILETLVESYDISSVKEEQTKQDKVDKHARLKVSIEDDEKDMSMINGEYSKLWHEQTSIIDEISMYQKKLQETQDKQMILIRQIAYNSVK